jgi:RNA recognition motif-containing protein
MEIFVGNLAYTATEHDVRQLFESYGVVERVHIPQDRGPAGRGALVSSPCPTGQKRRRPSPGCKGPRSAGDP